MANGYNSNPIRIDTTMAAGWRSLQTLNTGNLPTTLQQTSGVVSRQWGIRVTKVVWTSPGAAASFTVTDPIDGTILLMGDTPAGFIGSDPVYDNFFTQTWRDFKVTISAGALFIWYRA